MISESIKGFFSWMDCWPFARPPNLNPLLRCPGVGMESFELQDAASLSLLCSSTSQMPTRMQKSVHRQLPSCLMLGVMSALSKILEMEAKLLFLALPFPLPRLLSSDWVLIVAVVVRFHIMGSFTSTICSPLKPPNGTSPLLLPSLTKEFPFPLSTLMLVFALELSVLRNPRGNLGMGTGGTSSVKTPSFPIPVLTFFHPLLNSIPYLKSTFAGVLKAFSNCSTKLFLSTRSSLRSWAGNFELSSVGNGGWMRGELESR